MKGDVIIMIWIKLQIKLTDYDYVLYADCRLNSSHRLSFSFSPIKEESVCHDNIHMTM